MKEEDHIKLVEIGNMFWEEFGELCAKHIAKMPEDLEVETIMYLQEKCSIYGSKYEEFLSLYRYKAKDKSDNE